MEENKIDVQLEKMIAENVFPGATYGFLYKEERIIGAVGYKSLYPHIEINDVDTLYDMASLTKVVVTNTIISRMIYKNMIKLDDKVSKYLSRFKYEDITIYDLLTHSSGLPADLDKSFLTGREAYIDAIYSTELEYQTGTYAKYSDIGFILLGFIIEKVYGKALDEVAKKEVFIPLEMNDSCFNPSDKGICAPTEETVERGLVRGIVHDEKADCLGGVAGHAGLFSCVDDLINFSQMILNDGMVNGEEYLAKNIIDSWFTPCTEELDATKRTIGWVVGRYDGLTGDLYNDETITHTGFTGTSIYIDKINKIVCILLSNRVHPTRENKKLIRRRKEFTQVCYEMADEINKKKYLDSMILNKK